jgi:ParB family transcriptional regulator, chromosome partitioning protein
MSDRASKPKSRLGRGLSSLISLSTPDDPPVQHPAVPVTGTSATPSDTSATAPPAGVRVAEIPLSAIVPNPHQPRRHFNEASLNELSASLKTTGMIQPVIVRPAGDGSAGYQLIAGERRWRAARLAELPTVPAIIRDVDTVTQAQMALIENIQREDLNPLDRAVAYQALIKQLGLTQSELAGRLGEDRSTITHYLGLLELPEPVQAFIAEGRLTLAHAKLLNAVPDAAEQQRLAELAVAQNLSVRNLERLLQDGAAAKPAAPPPPASAHVKELERSLSRQLNLRVQVRGSRKKGHGRLVLHYASLDQFDELMSRLGVKTELD